MTHRNLPDDLVYEILEHWNPIQSSIQTQNFASIEEVCAKGTLVFSPDVFHRVFMRFIENRVHSLDFVANNVIRPEERYSREIYADKHRMELFEDHAQVAAYLCRAAAGTHKRNLKTLKIPVVAHSEGSCAILEEVVACSELQKLYVYQNSVEEELMMKSVLKQLPNLRSIFLSTASKISIDALMNSPSNLEELSIGRLDPYSVQRFTDYLDRKGHHIKHLGILGYGSARLSGEQETKDDSFVCFAAENSIMLHMYNHGKTIMPNLKSFKATVLSDLDAGNFGALCEKFSGYADLILRKESTKTVLIMPRNAVHNGPVFTEVDFSINSNMLLMTFPSSLSGLKILHFGLETCMTNYIFDPFRRDSVHTLLDLGRRSLETIDCRRSPTITESAGVVFGFLSRILERCGPIINLECSSSLVKHFNENEMTEEINQTFLEVASQMHRIRRIHLFRQESAISSEQCKVSMEEDVKFLAGIPYFFQCLIENAPSVERISFSWAPSTVCECCREHLKVYLKDALLAVQSFSESSEADVSDIYSELSIWWNNCH